LAPTLEELALVNKIKIEVELSQFSALRAYEGQERLAFGWGDWTVVAAVSNESYPQLLDTLSGCSAKWTTIGKFVEGAPSVDLLDGDNRIRAGRLESERFAEDSWFTQGIDEYVRRLLQFDLPKRAE
jgi:thiamine-monophosphate kinase